MATNYKLFDLLKGMITRVTPIKYGGTGKSTIAEARQHLNFIGTNSIASTADDTPANWAALGTGYVWEDGGKLLNQPARGFVENVYKTTSGGNHLVTQKLHTMSSGYKIYHRAGDLNNGWFNDWTLLLDETNGVQEKILWTNTKHTSNFAAQTLTFADDGYTEIEITGKWSTNYGGSASVKFTKGSGLKTRRLCIIDGACAMRVITVSWTSGNVEIEFSTGTYYSAYNGSAANATSYCIPLEIIATKGVS